MKNIVDIGKALFPVEPLPDGGHRRFIPEGCLIVTNEHKGGKPVGKPIGVNGKHGPIGVEGRQYPEGCLVVMKERDGRRPLRGAFGAEPYGNQTENNLVVRRAFPLL